MALEFRYVNLGQKIDNAFKPRVDVLFTIFLHILRQPIAKLTNKPNLPKIEWIL